MSPDPYKASAGASDPGSWNRYAYVGGDPINYKDSTGLYRGPGDDGSCATLYDACSDDGGYAGGALSIVLQLAWQLQSERQDEKGYCASEGLSYHGVTNGAGSCGPPVPVVPVASVPCPLVGIVGNYIANPNSQNPVHLLFAPQMAYDLDNAIATLNAEGIVLVINSGFRTIAENESNRNSPNGWSPISNHLVGLAIDVQMNSSNSAQIIAAMTAAGLTWGGTFSMPDRPHFQLPPAGSNPTAAEIAACQLQHPGGQ
jgi:hypothetical protein